MSTQAPPCPAVGGTLFRHLVGTPVAPGLDACDYPPCPFLGSSCADLTNRGWRIFLTNCVLNRSRLFPRRAASNSSVHGAQAALRTTSHQECLQPKGAYAWVNCKCFATMLRLTQPARWYHRILDESWQGSHPASGWAELCVTLP